MRSLTLLVNANPCRSAQFGWFLWKHHFTLLFLFLELIAFLLLVQYNKFHRSEAFNTLLSVSGTVNTSVHNLTEYVELKAVNEELSAENARLRFAARIV